MRPSMTPSSKDIAIPASSYFANARREMAEFVPEDAHVILECGCGEGVFGAFVKEQRNAQVWGIELHAPAAEKARTVLDNVLVGDVAVQLENVPDGHFDCVIFNDVLEHLVDPWAVLTTVKRKLSVNGVVVCSLPNIRFLKVLGDYVVRGEWHYDDHGICDRTHLHCFTGKSIRRLFDELEYAVVKLSGINPVTSWKFVLLNAVTLGRLADTRYLQFACVARPR